jgi:hopene-associated glycosyltransferase HpnB
MYDAWMVLTLASLVAWFYLWAYRGEFWKTNETLAGGNPWEGKTKDWPSVAVVVPARNEADVLPRTLSTLLGQEYPGPFHIFLVDDQSDDGTGAIARETARNLSREDRLTVVSAEALRPGWTGKLWAVEQGIRKARALQPEFLLLTDADIAYADGNDLARLVGKALEEKRDLVSLMVRLRVKTLWERLLIPAFVYFFAMLYPFSWAKDPRRKLAAAAGGCLLVRREALERAGGLAPVRGELIDDCSLAGLIKEQGRAEGGRIWLGLGESVLSLRPYDSLGEIWKMVARTAFVQLKFSYLLLAATLAGMILVFLAPPLGTVVGLLGACLHSGERAWWGVAEAGLVAWLLMVWTYAPMVSWYGLPKWYAVLLPFSAGLYTLMTLDSARRFQRGGGGLWKGRTYPVASSE